MKSKIGIIRFMKLVVCSVLLVYLVGCTTPVIKTEIQDPIVLHPPKPEPLDLQDISWEVWDAKTILQIAAELTEDDPMAVVVLPVWAFDAATKNTAEYERYIKEQNLALLYYRLQFPPKTREE